MLQAIRFELKACSLSLAANLIHNIGGGAKVNKQPQLRVEDVFPQIAEQTI